MYVTLTHSVNYNGRLYPAGMGLSLPDDVLDFINEPTQEKYVSSPMVDKMMKRGPGRPAKVKEIA